HVHFELRKDGQEVNPEDYFNQPVSQLDSVTEETEEDADETSRDFNPNDRSNELDGMNETPVKKEEDVDDPELEDEDTPVEDEDEEEEDDNRSEEDNEVDEDTSENSYIYTKDKNHTIMLVKFLLGFLFYLFTKFNVLLIHKS